MSVQSPFNSFKLVDSQPANKARENNAVQTKIETPKIANTNNPNNDSFVSPKNNDKRQANLWWYIGTAVVTAAALGILGAKGFLGKKIQGWFSKLKPEDKSKIGSFERVKTALGKNYEDTLKELKKQGYEVQFSNFNGLSVIAYKNKKGDNIFLGFASENKGVLNAVTVLHKNSSTRTDMSIKDGNTIVKSTHWFDGLFTNKSYNTTKQGFEELQTFRITDLGQQVNPLYAKEFRDGGFIEMVCPDNGVRFVHKFVNGKHKFWKFHPDIMPKTYIAEDDYKMALFDLYTATGKKLNIKLK